MQVATFEECCAKCEQTFVYPDFGDFAYGLFIFTSERGSAFAVFDGTQSLIWERIAAAICRIGPTIPEVHHGQLIRDVCARLADTVDGQGLRASHVCPHCQSTEWKWWQGARVGTTDLPAVSHRQFLDRPEIEQETEIQRLVLGAISQP